ncbi:MAG TPA: enoyl-CoA hydratase-related protein [Candidatus Binataceae bacterium]|nr:enoyl-CoA hydratase-related protein [Candidatus Binataceae bacterium]
MNFTDIIYEKSDRVATVTLNRPERMNAWRGQLESEMRTAMQDADTDPAIGAIIVTGAGKAFCAGMDMAGLSKIAATEEGAAHELSPARREGNALNDNFRGRFAWMVAMRTPIIGAINGACVGLGFANSLHYDIRIASDRARMGLIFPRRGLAIELGSSWLLPRIVGLANALDLAVTGRLIDAEEGHRIGLVTRVVRPEELLPAAQALASEIATQCSPLGVANAKRLVYSGLFTDLTAACIDEDETAIRMTQSDDFKEGIKAFMGKRAPRFIGR